MNITTCNLSRLLVISSGDLFSCSTKCFVWINMSSPQKIEPAKNVDICKHGFSLYLWISWVSSVWYRFHSCRSHQLLNHLSIFKYCSQVVMNMECIKTERKGWQTTWKCMLHWLNFNIVCNQFSWLSNMYMMGSAMAYGEWKEQTLLMCQVQCRHWSIWRFPGMNEPIQLWLCERK